MDALEALRKAAQTAVQAESDWHKALNELSQRVKEEAKKSENLSKL